VSLYTPGILTEVQIERARRACNMVRGSYLNHLMVYDEEMLKRESYQERLLNDLPRAIEEGEFKVYYQPKYDIQCEPCRLNSAEALIRWYHHELGMIPPCDFIPLFEKNGLVHIVDRFVWKEVANQIAKWREKYNILFPVSVNLSRAEILDSNLEESLKVLIAKYDLPVSAFKLEVTESAYTDDKQLVEIVRRLRENGYEIEMDDFGAGYSSLNMISSLPIDVLKMDMGFIRNIKEDNRELRLVELILDIARYMDVPVVAEGVETEEQLELLRKANCRYVQGYYFSRPLPAQEFEQWIEREIVQKEGRYSL
jgi:EAL domain-containing protein (putative c-di-GMP-specific phosphodiesterase class I)